MSVNQGSALTPVTNSLGKVGDAGSPSGTVQAKLADMETSVGHSADAASASGSIHAKIADVKNGINAQGTAALATSAQATNIQNSVNAIPTNTASQASVNAIPTNPQKRMTSHLQDFSVPGMTNMTLVSVSGKGRFLGMSSTNTNQVNATVIIDGTTIYNAVTLVGSGTILTPYGSSASTGSTGALIGLCPLEFQTSLTVQASDGVLTNASSAQVLWETE